MPGGWRGRGFVGRLALFERTRECNGSWSVQSVYHILYCKRSPVECHRSIVSHRLWCCWFSVVPDMSWISSVFFCSDQNRTNCLAITLPYDVNTHTETDRQTDTHTPRESWFLLYICIITERSSVYDPYMFASHLSRIIRCEAASCINSIVCLSLQFTALTHRLHMAGYCSPVVMVTFTQDLDARY